MKNKETLMLYIHIPFCQRKCDYCDFLSFATTEENKQGYFKALSKQISLKSELARDIPVSSIFIGGGTPSLVKEGYIYDLLGQIKNQYQLMDDAEISMEANPNSIRKEALPVYKEAGINRLSIGLQSADNEELKLLSRIHTYEEFLYAYDMVREAGFKNVNVDLMSGLPGQKVKTFEDSLKKVIALNPEHISAYSLIIEEGTKFWERYGDGEGLVSEDVDRQIYHVTEEMLKTSGYGRYEISNYAKAGYECRHNIGYWKRRPYLGFGISAASLFNEERFTGHRDLKAYISCDFSEEKESLSINEQMEEFMFLGLRMTEGVSVAEFKGRFNKDYWTVYGDVTEKLVKEGLLICGENVLLTAKGLDLANVAMAEFLLD